MRWLALAVVAFALAKWIVLIPLKVFVVALGAIVLIGYLVLTWIAYQLEAAEGDENEEG